MVRALPICLLLLPWQAWAFRAVVTVFEAPLLAKEDVNSPILQMIRRGDIIPIHQRHFWGGPLEPLAQRKVNQKLAKQRKDNGFYETEDRNGNTAWVQADFVKLIYGDEREQGEPVSVNPDPTDYRQGEPTGKNLPFVTITSKRISVGLKRARHPKANYPYSAAINSETFSTGLGFELIHTWQASSADPTGRVYLGGLFDYKPSYAEFKLSDGRKTRETIHTLSTGPIVSYDLHRSKDFRLSLAAAVTLNHHRATIQQKRYRTYLAKQDFDGFSISPKISPRLYFKELLPEVEVFVGFELALTPPHKLKATGETNSWWNADHLSIPLGMTTALFAGLHLPW